MILKKIDVLSCARLVGILYTAIGLLVGLFVAGISLIGAFGLQSVEQNAVLGMMFGIGAIVMLPILYGIIGFVGGALIAVLYNAVAGFAGGVRLEFEALPQAGL